MPLQAVNDEKRDFYWNARKQTPPDERAKAARERQQS